MNRTFLLLALALLPAAARAEDPYLPADQDQRPEGGTRILPDQFLRGFDPVTVYFSDNVGPGRGAADEGRGLLKIAPEWPGAWVWADKKTLQFRPAEPWPALSRFSFDARGTRRILTTMMSAPQSMSPQPDSQDLRPFRVVTLTFPQALSLPSLKQMLKLEVRDLPGLADSPRKIISAYGLSLLPRAKERDAATYAITLDEDVPEGKVLVVNVSLALGKEGTVLWTGRAATRTPFHLMSVRCGGGDFSLVGGASVPRDMALACGNTGEAPQLVFSATVQDLTLTGLKRLVRLEPAVADLHFQSYGARIALKGRFVPDVLYKMSVGPSPIQDDSGRLLKDPGVPDVYFHLGWKSPFLRWDRSAALLEAKGPRMLPLVGYGDPRADVRVYRVDPLYTGLWPFPERAVFIDEQSSPPFPGEEPVTPKDPGNTVSQDDLRRHIQLLGSPLASKVVDLPLSDKSGTTHFGLDLASLLDPVVGRNKPGTYLVGLRRLTGGPQRAYMRVQVTNLSLTSVEDRDRAILYVRTLDSAEPVRGASIVLEGRRKPPPFTASYDPRISLKLSTDGEGKAVLNPLADWAVIDRMYVQSGDDTLVIDPRSPPPRFADNHWSPSDSWLSWLTGVMPNPVNDRTLGFVFTERPIYRPGEPVFLKGYVRKKVQGELRSPGETRPFNLVVNGPDGQSWNVPLTFTALAGFQGEFKEENVPTGMYTATLYEKQPNNPVASRQFQIEAYRVPTFEVQITGATTVRLDAAFKVKAVARYYAGGNVSGQPIAWTVTRRPYLYVPKGRESFLFASSTQFAREGASRPPDTITQAGELDDQGSMEMKVNPALDLDGSARIYRFEATVTGADDQQVSTAQEVKALPPFVMGMKLARYSEKASDLRPEIIAVGVDDKAVKGQEISVRLYRRIWHSNLRETHFATGEAKYVTEQEDVKLLEKTVLTGESPVIPVLPVKEAGVYVVELFARDKLGRVQTMSADLYVGGPQPVAWQKSREGVFELTSDAKKYKPGQSAKLIIQSPFQSGRALVIVEEPGGNSYSWREVSGGKAVYEHKVLPQHTPNLPVHVVLMRGRLGEGKTDDARYKPATLAASLDVEVEPVKNQVNVTVDHPEVARPGTKVDLVVNLKDDSGRSLGGEVTLWLVDEAVLSLAKEAPLDPLTQMIVRNQRISSVRDSRNLVLGKLSEREEAPGGDGSDEEGEGGRRLVRKNFKTVPYYKATLLVPASGRLVVPVQLSDDLTNFKVRAVAIAGFERFGFKQSVLRVRLPVLVQPQLPRFVRQGDHFWAGGLARLVEGAEGPGTVKIKVSGAAEGKGLDEKVELKAAKAQSVLTGVTAKSSDSGKPSSITVRMDVTRLSDKAGDAFEVKLPVLPDRRVEQFAYFDTLSDGKASLRPFPEPPRAGTANQQLHFTNQPGVLELASSLEYLAAYPHGCLEQRMSQLYPEIALGSLLKKLELDTRFTPMLSNSTRKILEDLALHQDDRGLFGYWPGAPGDVQLTSAAVEFIVAAHKAGLPTDEKVKGRAVDALKRVLRSDYPGLIAEYRYNQQTAALRALTRIGQVDEHYLIDLYHHRAEMDPASEADLATAMSVQPAVFRTNLTAMKGELWDSVIVKLVKGKQVFQGIKKARPTWGYGYLGSTPSTVAAVFESLLVLDPTDPRHDLMRDALLSYGSASYGFGSTYDNRRAVMALGTYLERAKTSQKRATLSLGAHGDLYLDEGKKVAKKTVQLDTPATVSVSGGPVGVRVSYSYLPDAPGDKAPALKSGFIVSRNATYLHADGSENTHFDDKVGQVVKLSVGDILELHTRIVTDEARNHVALVVPFAAGLEPMNAALETSGKDAKPSQADSLNPTYVQRLDQEARYYFTSMPKGTHSFHFRVRATSEGSYVHPAPFAELMYRQEVSGRGEGMRIVVAGSREK
ncbi:MAG: alpha-2-macroglobulin [Myxococcaceae bacterium]